MKLIRKIDYNSPVVLTFVILSFLVLIIDQKTGGMANLMLFSVYQSSMTDPFFISGCLDMFWGMQDGNIM